MASQPLFSANWEPSLRGNKLRDCELLGSLIENNERPSLRDPSDAEWLPGRYGKLLAGVPYARDAIVESVVVIWRLRCTEDAGATDPLWGDHLEAWLVRTHLRMGRGL